MINILNWECILKRPLNVHLKEIDAILKRTKSRHERPECRNMEDWSHKIENEEVLTWQHESRQLLKILISTHFLLQWKHYTSTHNAVDDKDTSL